MKPWPIFCSQPTDDDKSWRTSATNIEKICAGFLLLSRVKNLRHSKIASLGGEQTYGGFKSNMRMSLCWLMR